jgi:hypothetical protein
MYLGDRVAALAAGELFRSATRGTSRMIAFVVSVNGQRVCTIGVGDSGVFGAHVSWVGRLGEPSNLSLSVGGLDSRTDEHIHWPAPPEIKIGDTVTIQVVETGAVDPPTERKTPAQLIEDEKAFLAQMEADWQARQATEGPRSEGGGEELREPPTRRTAQRDDEELPPFRAPWESRD